MDAVGDSEPEARAPRALSELELRLVDLLQADGRVPFSEIGRRLEVTEKTARRRVAQLVDEGVVHVTAVTEPRLLGYEAVAFACLRLDGSRPAKALGDELSTLPYVDYVTVTTGRFGIVVELLGADLGRLFDQLDHDIRSRPGVLDIETLLVDRVHYQQAYFGGERPGGVRPRQLDDLERTIIRMLAADGRASLREIAAALGVSETRIRNRYAALTESHAVQVLAIVNPLRIGYGAVAWIAVRVGNGSTSHEVADRLAEIDQTSYVAITIGRYDLLVECVCRTLEELTELIDDRIRTIEGVAAIEPWVYLDLHYKPLRPAVPDVATS